MLQACCASLLGKPVMQMRLPLQDWLADGGGWQEGGDNVKYSFFSMTKALQALHSQGIVHRCGLNLPIAVQAAAMVSHKLCCMLTALCMC